MIKWHVAKNKYKNKLDQLRHVSPYTLLSLSANASLMEIKKSYKQKLHLYHPDKAGEFMQAYSTEVTKILNLAVDEIQREQCQKVKKS